jgi:hypothetical protein
LVASCTFTEQEGMKLAEIRANLGHHSKRKENTIIFKDN